MCLFGSYAGLRTLFLGAARAADDSTATGGDGGSGSDGGNKLPIEQVLAVTAAGLGSGAISELAGYYSKPLESAGTGAGAGIVIPHRNPNPNPNPVWSAHRSMPKLPRPTIRALLPSAIATAIGFIALEYA